MKLPSFPTRTRPYLVANFVSTVDGKIAGPGPGYWPIGSAADLQMLMDLRVACDAVIHGRQTALALKHLDRLTSADFTKGLAAKGQKSPYTYIVLSAHPDSMLLDHIAPGGRPIRVVLVTTETAILNEKLPDGLEIWRCGEEVIDLVNVREMLQTKGVKLSAVEAGPRLFGALVAAKLVDELFLTIAPKLFGTSIGTPTMINGQLFKPGEVPELALESVEHVNGEIFARYRFKEVLP